MAYDSDGFLNPAPAEVEVDEVTKIILDAREFLSDPARWFKGQFESDEDGEFCVLGAIGYADDDWEEYCPSDARVQAAVRLANTLSPSWSLHTDAVSFVAAFNDDPTTTHADVLDLLDRAANTKPTQ